MEQKTQDRRQAGDVRTAIRAEWQTGPRTPQWDRLWAKILDDLRLDDPERILAPLDEANTDD